LKLLKNRYSHLGIIAILLLILLTRINCPVNTYSKKEIEGMKDLFIMKSDGKRSLFPVIVGIGKDVENIFAVPAKDAIGTIDLDNAISFLEFDDDKVAVKIIKKDFADEVSGDFDFSFIPQYSDEMIAYGQTRWMIFQNVKTNKNRTEFIINNLDDLIGKISVLDPPHNVFVIETLKPHGDLGRDKVLLLTQFSEDTFTVKKVFYAGIKSLEYNEPWTTSSGKLFIYDNKDQIIKVFDENGNPSSHPIQKIFAKNMNKFRRITEIVFHPELPFVLLLEKGNLPDVDFLRKQRNNGIISIEQYDSLTDPLYEERDRHALFLARWDTPDGTKQLIPLLSKTGNLLPLLDSVEQCSDFQFSPDGKWLVFRDETESRENPVFISIPVAMTSPNFLGEPLFLGKVIREGIMMAAKGTAWIKEPIGFVVTDGLVLYKWELGNIDKASVINQ
jgi:hypothetical protein